MFFPTGEGEIPNSLIMVGHMGVFHNVDAAIFLAHDILPKVRAEIPDAHLKIVGAAPNPQVRALACNQGVEVMGYVPDLNTALNSSAVFVAPLRFAAGVQNKVLEAMAAGRPVVTSNLVNNGLGAQPDRDLLTADTPKEFTAAILKLLQDNSLRSQIGRTARAICEGSLLLGFGCPATGKFRRNIKKIEEKYFHMSRTNIKGQALITGGAGFIGSHLAEALLNLGQHVTIIDDLSTGRFENIAHLTENPNFRFVIDTITNEAVLDRLASDCNVIYHLAAAVGVRLIVEKPVHTIQTNIMGTEAVLRAAKRYRAKTLIASTSEVYGKSNKVPFQEDDDVVLGSTLHSRWSYAATKMVDEFLGLAYYQEQGLPVVFFRLFNTVGPRQVGRYGMVIPRFVHQALKGEPITVYSDGKMTRCFMHVSDAVNAILGLAKIPDAVGQVFNIGAKDEISILDLARTVLAVVDGSDTLPPEDDPRLVFIPYEQAYAKGFEDMRRRVPDTTKIHQLIGWQPQYNLRKILKDVVADLQKT